MALLPMAKLAIITRICRNIQGRRRYLETSQFDHLSSVGGKKPTFSDMSAKYVREMTPCL